MKSSGNRQTWGRDTAAPEKPAGPHPATPKWPLRADAVLKVNATPLQGACCGSVFKATFQLCRIYAAAGGLSSILPKKKRGLRTSAQELGEWRHKSPLHSRLQLSLELRGAAGGGGSAVGLRSTLVSTAFCVRSALVGRDTGAISVRTYAAAGVLVSSAALAGAILRASYNKASASAQYDQSFHYHSFQFRMMNRRVVMSFPSTAISIGAITSIRGILRLPLLEPRTSASSPPCHGGEGEPSSVVSGINARVLLRGNPSPACGTGKSPAGGLRGRSRRRRIRRLLTVGFPRETGRGGR